MSSKSNYNDAELPGRVDFWKRSTTCRGVERSGDASLRRNRPGGRAKREDQQSRHRDRFYSSDVECPGERVPGARLFENIVKAAGKTLNNATFNKGGQSLTKCQAPRRRRKLQLRTGTPRRQRTFLDLRVRMELRREQNGA